MVGNAKGSPQSKGVDDLDARVARLEKFENWGALKPLPLEDLAGSDSWNQHWRNLEEIETKMREAQRHAEVIKKAIQRALLRHSHKSGEMRKC